MGRLTKLFATTSCSNKVEKQFLLPEFSGDTDYQQKMVDKLGNIEDIEEEIGIDITILFKALKNGVLYKNYANEIYLYKVRGIEKNCLALIDRFCNYAECDIPAYYKDYGKTWALTKGELGNE